MQTFGSFKQVAAILLMCSLAACHKADEFDAAIAKHRNTLVDQVNPVQKGLPFFTVETLNPVWQLTPKTPIVNIPAFHLIDQDGNARDNTMFQNKISVVGFIFASCSGFCPFLVEGMKSVEREMKSVMGNVQFVALTVNPEEDTPERLKSYSLEKNIDSKSWVLLTGDKDTIYSLAKKTFASQAFRRKTTATSFVHSEHLYVIDGDRNLRGILNGTRVNLRADARAMLSQLSTAK